MAPPVLVTLPRQSTSAVFSDRSLPDDKELEKQINEPEKAGINIKQVHTINTIQ
jgi:hypothetical protein